MFTPPKERARRRAISESQRRRWAERRAADGRAYRIAFAALAPVLSERGRPADRELLGILVDGCLRTAELDDRARWERWRQIVEAGRRIKIATYSAEVFVGEDLAALDEARALLADGERFEATRPRQ